MVAVQRIIHIRKPVAVGMKLIAKGFLPLFFGGVFLFLWGRKFLIHGQEQIAEKISVGNILN